ncbi:MAG TPA: hypothetical protein VNJ03_09240 [Vicinamibacterales bacterium]|nr:hypothetical protein [Vicinamibacterales bacterium]
MRRHARSIVLTCVFLAAGTHVDAQEQDPAPPPLTRERIGRFVADARVALPSFKQDVMVAASLGVDPLILPTRGFGIVAGAHVFPFRKGSFALGIGGEVLRARASKTAKATTKDAEDGPTLKNRWSNVSPQVSLNFGSKDGWSYVTVGSGTSKLTFELEEEPQPDAETGVRTLNYGGGARWFVKKHLAFTLDLRFYSINAQEAATGRIPTPKMRLMVFSGGMSIR